MKLLEQQLYGQMVPRQKPCQFTCSTIHVCWSDCREQAAGRSLAQNGYIVELTSKQKLQSHWWFDIFSLTGSHEGIHVYEVTEQQLQPVNLMIIRASVRSLA